MRKGLGPVQGKIATAFSPVAVTPDELGAAWDGRRVSRPLSVQINGESLGAPDCSIDMQFDFPHLIAHAARTRPLRAGAVLGENEDVGGGIVSSACTINLEVMELGDGPTGPSWSDRMTRLRDEWGPFRLAFWESLVRVADWRATARHSSSKGGQHE